MRRPPTRLCSFRSITENFAVSADNGASSSVSLPRLNGLILRKLRFGLAVGSGVVLLRTYLVNLLVYSCYLCAEDASTVMMLTSLTLAAGPELPADVRP